MSSEAIGLLGLFISVLGLIVQIFGQDIRSRLIGAFDATAPEADATAAESRAQRRARRSNRRWAFPLLGVLALVSLALILRSLTGASRPAQFQPVASAAGSENDLMNLADGPAPLPQAPVPRGLPAQKPADVPAGPFDWARLRGEVPIWYRTAKDDPLSIYVDAASVETPTPDTRAFWAVAIPARSTPDMRRVAYMKHKYRIDCARRTITMGQTITYDNSGQQVSAHSESEISAIPEAREKEIAPGSKGQAALRFVCSGPNENSVEVLRGGNMAEYLVPNITRAPG